MITHLIYNVVNIIEMLKYAMNYFCSSILVFDV